MVTIIRFSQSLNSSSNRSPTLLSDSEYPGFSTFVESDSRANTPSLPSLPNLAISIMSPCMGETSILKSPVCMTIPIGVRIARETASATLWFT